MTSFTTRACCKGTARSCSVYSRCSETDLRAPSTLRICTSPPAHFLFPSSQTRQHHPPVCFWGLGYFGGLGQMEIVVCVCGWRRISLILRPGSLMVERGRVPSLCGWVVLQCVPGRGCVSVRGAHLRAAPLGLGNVLPDGRRCPLRPCSPLCVCTSCHAAGSALRFLRSPRPSRPPGCSPQRSHPLTIHPSPTSAGVPVFHILDNCCIFCSFLLIVSHPNESEGLKA